MSHFHLQRVLVLLIHPLVLLSRILSLLSTCIQHKAAAGPGLRVHIHAAMVYQHSPRGHEDDLWRESLIATARDWSWLTLKLLLFAPDPSISASQGPPATPSTYQPEHYSYSKPGAFRACKQNRMTDRKERCMIRCR